MYCDRRLTFHIIFIFTTQETKFCCHCPIFDSHAYSAIRAWRNASCVRRVSESFEFPQYFDNLQTNFWMKNWIWIAIAISRHWLYHRTDRLISYNVRIPDGECLRPFPLLRNPKILMDFDCRSVLWGGPWFFLSKQEGDLKFISFWYLSILLKAFKIWFWIRPTPTVRP